MKEKYRKLLPLILCILILCTGCSNGKKYEDDDVKDIINATTQSADRRYPNFDFDSNENPYNGTYGPYKQITEDGYYDMIGEYEYDAKNEYYRYQAYGYYDLNTDTLTPLCSKPYCTHETRECEAMFATVHFHDTNYMGEWETWHISSNLIYYKHRLYTLYYDEKNGSKVVSYDATGGDMKTEIILEKDPRYIMDKLSSIKDGKVYGTSRTIDESGKYVYYINEWDLETGKKKQIFVYDNGEELSTCNVEKISEGVYRILYRAIVGGQTHRLIYNEAENTYTKEETPPSGTELKGDRLLRRGEGNFPDKFIVVDKATGESETLELEGLEERYIDSHYLIGDYLFVRATSKLSIPDNVEIVSLDRIKNNDIAYNALLIYDTNTWELIKGYELAIYDDITNFERGDVSDKANINKYIERYKEQGETHKITRDTLINYKELSLVTFTDPRFVMYTVSNSPLEYEFEIYFDVEDIENDIIQYKIRNKVGVTDEDVISFIKELK